MHSEPLSTSTVPDGAMACPTPSWRRRAQAAGRTLLELRAGWATCRPTR